MTLRQIGALMGLQESFICRVRKGERDFTLQRLQKLETALGKPLYDDPDRGDAGGGGSAPTAAAVLPPFAAILATLESNGQTSTTSLT